MQKYPLEKVVLIILQSQRGEAFLLHKFALKSELGELLGNPKGTKSFSSWSEFTDFVNEMPIKTIQPFVSNFNAFAGEGFYGNVVQGLVIKQLEDAVFIFGIAIDGTLIFRKRNYPDVSTWEDPKIIIHSNNWHKIYFVTDLGELIGTATSNKSGLMSPKLYCAIPNSYVVNGATELKGKYVKIISVNDWNGSIINVKVSNYGNGSYFYIILCLATNNIGRWVSGKLIAGNISGFSFYRVDKSIYMFIPDSIPDLYVTLDASMGNVSYGEEYENTIDLSNPITISWHNSLSTLDLGGLIGINDSWFRSRIPTFKGDVETLVVSGIYGITPESINNPINGYGILSVFSVGNESRVMYLLISVNGATFIRVKYDKSDSKWKKLSLAS